MKFNEIDIEGAFVIDLEKFKDDRGSFARTWCQNEFQSHGIMTQPVQANTAFSKSMGTIRGLHYQVSPFEEAKLIRCVRGAIFDVMIDIRTGSSTYKKWYGVELSSDMDRMVYVPEGCAHGYQTLVDETEINYLSSAFYSPDAEKGIKWNDPAFEVAWPIKDHILISEKDQSWPLSS